MNVDPLREKLIAAARSHPPTDAVPFAFEKRVMARVRSAGRPDAWTLWGPSLWRAALLCVVVAALCGVWGFGGDRPTALTEDLSVQLENALYATAAEQLEDLW